MMQDVYFKKMIDFYHDGQTLHFRVSQDLFSSHQIDIGTVRLLKTLTQVDMDAIHKVLDLGCGYGPIGLTLKKLDESRDVHLVDRDALAVEYARQNADVNQLSDTKIYGSLGYDDVQATDFDLIISNIPGKAGDVAISSFLLDAYHYLNPEGLVAIVVVSPLEPLITDILTTPGIEIVYQESRSGHAIFHYRFSPDFAVQHRAQEKSFDRGIYHREQLNVLLDDLDFSMITARGLPEFDSLSYHSQMLIQALLRLEETAVDHAIVYNPGQGHTAVALWQSLSPETIILVDRDLLSLGYAHYNLALNGCPDDCIQLLHQPGLSASEDSQADLIIGVLRKSEGQDAMVAQMTQAAAYLAPNSRLIVAGSSTVITRLVKWIQSENLLRIHKRKRNKGQSLLTLGLR